MSLKFVSALVAIAILICFEGFFSNKALASDETTWGSQTKAISAEDSISSIEQAGEQILVVVKDLLGKENYSKVIIINEKNNLVVNPSKRLAAGVYFVIASSHNNRLYNQKITVN